MSRMLLRYCCLYFCLGICAVPAFAQQPQQTTPVQQALPPSLPAPALQNNTPASQPPTPVPVLSIIPPSKPVPAPVIPQFVTTPPPKKTEAANTEPPLTTTEQAAKALDSAREGITDLIQNPQQVQEIIRNAPQTVPKQLGVVKDRVLRITQDPNRFNGNNFEHLKWQHSLMFSPEQLARLYAASQGLTDQSVGATLVEVKVPRVAPAFYLNSVLYNTPTNWTIWLNFRRIRAGSSFPELKIEKVDRDAVQFIWQTDQLDFLSPGWEKNVPEIPLEPGQEVPFFAYRSKDGLLEVDRSRRFVKFTIGPHQSFVSREMRIREGHVKSIFFETVERIATPGPQTNTAIQIEGAAPAPVVPQAPAAPAGKNRLNPLAPPAVMLQNPASP